MGEVKLSADENLYVKAKEYCRKTKPEFRGDLFYALLDWCDQHDEIRESLGRKYDTYTVEYVDNDGKAHRESFNVFDGGNPHHLARQRYSEVLERIDPKVIELRRSPNPWLPGQYRLGMLIMSHEKLH